MAMDFFAHQDKARQKTSRLVWMFGAAVIAIIMLTYLVVSIFIVGAGLFQDAQKTGKTQPVPFEWSMLWDPQLLLIVGAIVLAVVGFASLYKLAELRAGGKVIAESLGGRLLSNGARDLTERKILNVVEEMAIASGVPVPPVYMMDNEKGINAFAAGFSPSDAVIGVTRGCVENLTRDELQGVMAHEFSHILNGDMRLNIRLMGVIYGILVIGLIGLVIIRIALLSGNNRRSNEKSNPIPFIVLGGALLVIGYSGVFFANLIKAAVSRQREFLADASAVQFTRNPAGIAGALKRIAVASRGFQSSESYASHLNSPNAEEASHMFFGEGVSHWLGSSMATHPPLAQRIKQIDPSFDGNMANIKLPPVHKDCDDAKQATAASRPGLGAMATVGMMAAATATQQPAQPIELEPANSGGVTNIGKVSQAHLNYASKLVSNMPEPVVRAAREPYGARALVYALLLDDDRDVRAKQIEQLEKHADEHVYRDTLRLEPMVMILDEAAPLALIDMAIAPLRELSPTQYETFKQNVIALISADHKVSLFEWTLQRILMHHLEPAFNNEYPQDKAVYGQLHPVTQQLCTVISTLSYVGSSDNAEVRKAFDTAAKEFGSHFPDLTLLDVKQCSLKAVGEALDELVKLKPIPKRRVVHALAQAISSDGKVTVREAELFRAIVDSLDCPVPPLLPGQPLM
jgi:Zn-dependent protease with chaperone function